jgi:hypothetical protein
MQSLGPNLELLHERDRHLQRWGGRVHGSDQAGCLPRHLREVQVLVAERLTVNELEHGHPQPIQPGPQFPGLGRSRPGHQQLQAGEGVTKLQSELRPRPLDGAWPA